jgi:hypothetical protein
MNKAQLKALIKPVVKECIQEVLIEEGLLTEVVSQVAAGMNQQPIVENKQKKKDNNLFNEDLQMKRKTREVNQKLQEHRKKLLDSIGQDAYNGVDLFEGTEPMKQGPAPGAAPKFGKRLNRNNNGYQKGCECCCKCKRMQRQPRKNDQKIYQEV